MFAAVCSLFLGELLKSNTVILSSVINGLRRLICIYPGALTSDDYSY